MKAQRPYLIAAFIALAASCLEGQIRSHDFAARSKGDGKTLFSPVAAADSGVSVENRYDDREMWWRKFREFALGAIGTGVAVGDYDGDGRPDLLVVSKTEGHRLFRNLGGWKFSDVTVAAGVAAPPDRVWETGATWADIDNDGRLDLYVLRHDAPNLLYLNQGDGTFREVAAEHGLAIRDASAMAAFCDYDRDGFLDLFLVTNVLDFNRSPGQPDRLLHNDGHGNFTDVTSAAGIAQSPDQGHAATWWDCDNDGWPDLYVSNDFAAPDQLYRNNHDGTFSPWTISALPHMPNSSMGADAADFDNDGRIDLFATDMAATTHEKDQRSAAESREQLVERYDDPLVPVQIPRNALFLNRGVDRFPEVAQLAGLAATDWTWSPRCEDFDLDGRVDVIVTTGMVRELHNIDLIAQTDRAGSIQERLRITQASPLFAERNLAFRNLGDLQFAPVGPAWGVDQLGVSFGSATGDFDGDGDLDLVFTNYQGNVTLLRNDVDHGHRVTFALQGTASNRFGVGAEVRLETKQGVQVRQLMLARGYLSSSEPMLHFGLGEETKIERVSIVWPSGTRQELRDLSVDCAYTITEPPILDTKSPSAPAPQFSEVTAAADLAVSVREAAFDETSTQPLLPHRLNRGGPALAVGDLDGDGLDDFCLGGTTLDPARVLLADESGRFKAAAPLPLPHPAVVNDGPILLFDADGDGRNDLLLTAGGVAATPGTADYQPRLLLNKGAARFAPAPADAVPAIPRCVGAAAAVDFDRDGHVDVFLGSRVRPGEFPLSEPSVLLANRGGHFEDVTASIAPGLRELGLVTSALWSDVDDDGWPDLVVACEWGGVRYFHNEAGKRFVDRSSETGFSAAGTGWWSSLAAADFNGDGRLDYVAGNVGLNTPYRATPEKPVLLFRGEVEPGRAALTFEGYYENERLLPRRSRRSFAAALPGALARFPKTNDFARASLADIVGADALGRAQRWAATELQSGVFLSQTDGTYRFQPLPRLAQIAPAQGIVAGDFDGDGNADVLMLQNSYTPFAATGNFDGGLGQLLRGDGRGNFTLVDPDSSGIVAPGDGRALVTTDLDRDGWPDVVGTRNRNPALAWRNNGHPGKHMLAVTLHGKPGNAAAIGARVTVELANGTTQTSEVRAGGGVYSQSSAQLFFGWPDAAEPKRLRVRWPSGERTEQALDGKTFHLVFSEP